jgi:hypothetical protein
MCYMHISDTNTMALMIKEFREVFEQYVIGLLLDCYVL